MPIPIKANQIPPSFSTLHATQDGVLVCTKKDGNIEEFKYVPLNDVLIGDQTLGAYLERVRVHQMDVMNYVKSLESRIESIENRQNRFVNIFKPKTAEGGAKK